MNLPWGEKFKNAKRFDFLCFPPKNLGPHADVSHWISFDSDPHLQSQIASREFLMDARVTENVTCEFICI